MCSCNWVIHPCYYPDSSTISKEAERSKRIYQFNSLVNNHLMEGDTWKGNDLMNRMNFFLRRKTQKLCKGSVSYGIFGLGWFFIKKDVPFFMCLKIFFFSWRIDHYLRSSMAMLYYRWDGRYSACSFQSVMLHHHW